MNLSEKPSLKVPEEIERRLQMIHLDNISGASVLTKKAAETLLFLVDNLEVSPPFDVKMLVERTAVKLMLSQPSMASIFNLANETLLAVDDLEEERKIRETVRGCCKSFVQRLEESSRVISEQADVLIEVDSTIMVHSYSVTVLDALLFSKKRGKRFDVICTESRPMKEGVGLAEQLGKAGIDVKLIVDSAVFSFLSDADIIMVGADTLSPYGLVNKIGTFGLAVASKEFRKDFYTLCSTDKILPKRGTIEDEKDPLEITSKCLPNVTPINRYFDLTPLTYLTGVVTEKGIMTPSEIKEYMKGLKIHRLLSDFSLNPSSS